MTAALDWVSAFRKASNSAGVERHRIGAELLDPGLDRRIVERLGDFVVQPLYDLLRRSAGREHAEPERVVGIGITRFQRGRDIGQRVVALEARERKAVELVALDQRHDRRQRREIEVDPPAQHFAHRIRRAAERNVQSVKTGTEPEAFGVEMGRSANAAGAEGDRAGLLLGLGDEILHALEASGRRHQHVGKLAERDDRGEILRGVERQLGETGRHDGVDRGIDQERVAVRIGLGGLRHAERAAGAGPVLEHEGLAELLADLVEYRAADGVERTARRKRDHQLDGLARRPGLRQRALGQGGKQNGEGEEDAALHDQVPD